jgi:hypothetical protein
MSARGIEGEPSMTARKVGDHVEVEEEEVRAGQSGVGVRYVLIAGVVLVIIGFGAVAIGWFG